jgi:hypothetical protein
LYYNDFGLGEGRADNSGAILLSRYLVLGATLLLYLHHSFANHLRIERRLKNCPRGLLPLLSISSTLSMPCGSTIGDLAAAEHRS